MKRFVLALTVVCLLAHLKATIAGDAHGASAWTYEGESGPGHWASLAQTCGGKQQSPIDIKLATVKELNFQPLFFGNYDVTPKVTNVSNNGHTAVLSMETDRMPYISDGGLLDKYIFAQVHFHWGKDSSRGSEHLINSGAFPAEFHLVHYNEKYKTFKEATGHSDGLAVVGVFVKAATSEHSGLKPFVEVLGKIKEPGASTTLVSPLALKDMLPSTTAKFFRYQGSLTTPDCNEIVTWTVLDAPVTVSEKQLNKFRSLQSHEGPLVDNFRPVQPLNERQVYVRSGSAKVSVSLAAGFLSIVIQLLFSKQ